MKRSTLLTAVLAASVSSIALAEDKVTIEFAYPYSHLFDVTYEAIMPAFEAAHPNIEVKFRATYEDYEDGTNTILRETVADDLPDVTMQGLNRQAILVDKGIAKSLETFIAEEADFEKDGYHQAMLDLGTFNSEVYGLPFSVSLPVGYYNMDLLKAGGIEALADHLRRSHHRLPDQEGKRCQQPHVLGLEHHRQLVRPGADVEPGRSPGRRWHGQARHPEAATAFETMKSLFRGCDMKNLD